MPVSYKDESHARAAKVFQVARITKNVSIGWLNPDRAQLHVWAARAKPVQQHHSAKATQSPAAMTRGFRRNRNPLR